MNADFQHLVAATLRIPVSAITDELDRNSTPAWDSLDHGTLMAGLKQKFNVKLTMKEIIDAQSIRDLRHLLNSKGFAA